MDLTSALPTFVITLREGVEATLVVGLVLAFLKKGDRTELTPWVWGGVLAGLLLSVLVGLGSSALIQGLDNLNPQYAVVVEPLLEGVFSLLAIGLLGWMLLWMTQQARSLKGQVEGAVGNVLAQGQSAGWGVFGLILFAVLREGFETVLFIAAKFQQGLIPALGALGGIAVASLLGVLLFKWGIKINIRQFFKVMGVLLLLIVSGLVITACGHFDSALSLLAQMDRQSESLCFFYERFARNPSCILGPQVFDGSQILPDDRFPGLVLSALFGYTQKLYLVQALAYGFFLGIAGWLYGRSLDGKPLLPSFSPASRAHANN
jgi:high-affinity iron transporter